MTETYKRRWFYSASTLLSQGKRCKRFVKPLHDSPKKLNPLDIRTDLQKLADKWRVAIRLTPPNGQPAVFCEAGRFSVRFYDQSGRRLMRNGRMISVLSLGRIRDCDLLAAYAILHEIGSGKKAA